MIPEVCCVSCNDSNVKVEEFGRKAIIVNNGREEFIKVRVDGCVITEGKRADWVIEKPGCGILIVELKGRDVESAADQVHTTALHWAEVVAYPLPIAGLIVAKQYPKMSTSIQRKQLAFAKRHKRPLRVVNGRALLTFESALRF